MMTQPDISLDELQQIEQHFHQFILDYQNGRVAHLIREYEMTLPALAIVLETEPRTHFFAIQGYMGGAHYFLRVADDPVRLVATISSRMDFTGPDVYQITAEGYTLLYDSENSSYSERRTVFNTTT